MKLSRLMDAIEEKEMNYFTDAEITGITSDSSAVQEGSLFVAVKGIRTDGHLFVKAAHERGAAACVTEKPVGITAFPNIVVPDSDRALALLAARFYGNPVDELWMCGVSGTNGKTSTVHLLRSICEAASWGKVGVLGTIGHGAGTSLERALHTTPDAVKLHALFNSMKKQGCRGVVMEVSSHAVRQQRIWGIEFEVGILTNVTRDHLDYHKTLEDYVDAKREFCASLVSGSRKKKKGVLVYFRDDAVAGDIGESFEGDKISVGLSARADVFARNIEAGLDGTKFILCMGQKEGISVRLQLLGRFNVQNALLAAAAASVLKIDEGKIKAGLETLANVPGRFEAFGGGELPVVIVDYCHTPDSLERVLKFCLDLHPGRLIAVFGCGGDRDQGKRPIMGQLAQELSDECHVTSDNPRTEDPEKIIEEILSGMDRSRSGLFIEVDRRKAIRQAIKNSCRGDVVAICGKGHEDYQIIGTERYDFSDREEAEKALARWRKQ